MAPGLLVRWAMESRALAVMVLLAGCEPGVIEEGAPAEIDRPLGCSAAAPLPGSYVAVPVDPGRRRASPGAPTVVYLHRSGVTLGGGYDDASRDRSSVVASQGKKTAVVPAAGFSESAWTSVVACIRDEFARFNVLIVDQRPQAPGYHMAVFGGNGRELGFGGGVGGVAPIDPNNCEVIDGAVTFIFTGAIGLGAQLNCEVAAQEISHAFSLDHELLASDPMTYLQYNGHKTFQDVDAPCGEFSKRACICKRPTQNSVKLLTQKLGAASMGPPGGGDTTAPTVTLLSPASGSTLPAGPVGVIARATDDDTLASVTLKWQGAGGTIESTCGDGKVPCAINGPDHTFTVPATAGPATFSVRATDKAGNLATTPSRGVTIAGQPPGGGNNGGNSGGGGAMTVEVSFDDEKFDGTRIVIVRATARSPRGAAMARMNLVWTDVHNVTSSWPLCPDQGRWSIPVQIARRAGPRKFFVEAASAAGARAVSTVTSISVED